MQKNIDITKPVRTRDGKEVLGLKRVPYNSLGERVTYPLKGSIVIRKKPLLLEYCIWSDEGVYDIVWRSGAAWDLVQD